MFSDSALFSKSVLCFLESVLCFWKVFCVFGKCFVFHLYRAPRSCAPVHGRKCQSDEVITTTVV